MHPARVADGRVDLEEEPEHQRVDRHLREWVEQRPAPAEDRPLVLAAQLPEREVGEQLSVAADLGDSGHRRGAGAGAPGRRDTLPPDADHLRLRALSPELRERWHAAAPAARPGAPRPGARGRRLRRLPRQHAPPAGDVGGGRRHRPAGALGRLHAVHGLGRRAQLRQPGRGRAVRGPPASATPPTSCTCTRCRRSASAWWRWPRRRGAATVVTMHDFWWVCARQFLVERSHRPCCLVVAAGDCPCEVGRPHLDATGRAAAGGARAPRTWCWPPRGRRPRCSAPTASRRGQARRRRERDGPAGARLTRAGAAPTARPVVVRYTGGSNPMKGADVLVEAAHQLGAEPGLRHRRPRPRRRRASATVAPSRAPASSRCPPTSPRSSTSCWRPPTCWCCPRSCASRTRSSPARRCCAGCRWSSPTRSAPRRWCDHGGNGLVVPAADPALLAAALRSLDRPVDARGPCERARPHHPAVRSVDDAGARGSSERYERLLSEPRPAPSADAAPSDGSCSWWASTGRRCATGPDLPAEALALHGVAQRRPSLPRPRRGATCAAEPTSSSSTACRPPRRCSTSSRRCASAGTPVRVRRGRPDLRPRHRRRDPRPAPAAARRGATCGWRACARYRTTMEACDAYIGSTPRLVEHARRVVGHRRAPVRERRRRRHWASASDIAAAPAASAGTARGSATSAAPPPTTPTGDTSSAAVVEVLEAHPDAELWLGGHLTPTEAVIDRLGDRVRRLPFTAWHRSAGPAPRPRRQPGPARAGQPVQRGQERDQVAGGRPRRRRRPSPAPRRPSETPSRTDAPGGSRTTRRTGPRCSSVPSRMVTSARWSAPGLDALRSCAGHRTGRATATCRSWPRCAPTRATVRHP